MKETKVIILGSGIIGVLSAYFLQHHGFEVTVIERHANVAEECSFANGSQLSYSHAEPWASWPMLYKALKWLGNKEAPLYMRFSLDPDLYKWLWKFLTNCPSSAIKRNTQAILQLNFFSKKVLHEILAAHQIDFNLSNKGILHIYNNLEYMNSLRHQFTMQKEYYPDFQFQVLDKYGCIDLEPALFDFTDQLCGGIYCMQDEVGSTRQFTEQLAEICQNMGVNFLFNTEIETFTLANNKISGLMTNKGFYQADKYVAALGAYNQPMLKKIGIDCNIYPMKGYTITVPVENNHIAPYLGVTDEIKKVVYSRIDENRMRIAGTAEFAGFSHDISPNRINPILEAYKRIFPHGGDFENITTWTCLRPQRPSNVPIISGTKYSNLFINGGHGTLGWTMAAGSAKILQNVIQNQKLLDIDADLYKI